ncbi:caspase domain-containing protein [Aspergillus spinulosporus]
MASASKLHTPSKRALLIGSPTYGLRGPQNDVEDVGNLLRNHGFRARECYGPQATRDGIMSMWKQLIFDTQPGDTVVIYYSGHGGFAKDPKDHSERRYQFIVPTDYVSSSSPDDFKGIFDIEISQLVHLTTRMTQNVTVILDCCFSGRMARDPTHGGHAVRKALENVPYEQVSEAYERTAKRALSGLTSVEGNPHAVRIVAATDSEVAFEYDEGHGRMVGAFTKALLANLESALQVNLTWKHMMLRVSDLVNTHFPYQHPHVEGPHNRVVFSQQEKDVNVYQVDISDTGEHILQAGQTAGVRVGNTYNIIYNDSAARSEGCTSQGIGAVTSVTPFKAILQTQSTVLGQQTAHAYPDVEAQYRYPVSVADSLSQYVDDQIRRMKFIQLFENGPTPMVFARLDQQDETIYLSICGEPRANFDANGDTAGAVSKALQLANSVSRAAHLLSSKPTDEARLDHEVQITLSKMKPGGHGTEDLATNGTAQIDCSDRICITLNNTWIDTVYVSVFDVNAAGKISLLSQSSPCGIKLRSGSQYVIGKAQHTDIPRGMGIIWPKDIHKDVKEPIPEWVVCFVTDAEIDLRCLERDCSGTQSPPTPRGDPSQLEKIAYQLTYGQGRDIGCEENPGLKWDLTIIPFSLLPVQA